MTHNERIEQATHGPVKFYYRGQEDKREGKPQRTEGMSKRERAAYLYGYTGREQE